MKISRDTTIIRSTDAVETTVGAEIVLMVLASGKCYGLGETGSDVWRLLANRTAVRPIVEQLSREYDAPPEVIEQDVLELLENLRLEGLVQVASD